MSDAVIFAVRLSSAIGCGLMAGLFFAFSVAILNPVFLAVFLGTAVACLAVLGSSLMRWQEPGAALFAAGAALYLVGAFLITIIVNVPMNNALASTAPADPTSAGQWASFLSAWTAWNHVRTLASLAARVAITLGLWRLPA